MMKLIDIDNGVVLMTVKVMFNLYSESNHHAKFLFRAHVSVTTTPAWLPKESSLNNNNNLFIFIYLFINFAKDK